MSLFSFAKREYMSWREYSAKVDELETMLFKQRVAAQNMRNA